MSTVTIDPNAVETSPIEDAQAVSSISGNEKLLAFVGGQLKTFSRSKIKEFVGAISAFEGEKTLKKVIDYTTGTPDFEAPLLEDFAVQLKGNYHREEVTEEVNFGMGLNNYIIEVESFVGLRALENELISTVIGCEIYNYFYQAIFTDQRVPLYILVKESSPNGERHYTYNNFAGGHFLINKELNEYQTQDVYSKIIIDFQGNITDISPTQGGSSVGKFQNVLETYSFEIQGLTVNTSDIVLQLYGWNGTNIHNLYAEVEIGGIYSSISSTVTPGGNNDATLIIDTSSLAINSSHNIEIVCDGTSNGNGGELLRSKIELRKGASVNDRCTYISGRLSYAEGSTVAWLNTNRIITEVVGSSRIEHENEKNFVDPIDMHQSVLQITNSGIYSKLIPFPTYYNSQNAPFVRSFMIRQIGDVNDGVTFVDVWSEVKVKFNFQ